MRAMRWAHRVKADKFQTDPLPKRPSARTATAVRNGATQRQVCSRGVPNALYVSDMTIDEITENFALLDDWEDRYRYLIELGRLMPSFPAEARTDANKVQGCASQVWLSTTIAPGPEPILTFTGDSDAHIVKGLIAVLVALYSGGRRRRFSMPTPSNCSTASAYANT